MGIVTDDPVRLRINASQQVVLRGGDPDGAIGEGGRIRAGGYRNFGHNFVGLRIDAREDAFLVRRHPDASGSHGDAAFGIRGARGNLRLNLPGVRIDADQAMRSATRNPDAAESRRQSRTRLLDGDDCARADS